MLYTAGPRLVDMNELWSDGTKTFRVRYGRPSSEKHHLFIGFVSRLSKTVRALGPTLGTFTSFDTDDYSANVSDATEYTQARNALPGILLNAIRLRPLSFVVVALPGTSFQSPRGGNNVVPEGNVLAVNIRNPCHYQFVSLKRIGTAQTHILHSALDAIQKLYNCYDPDGEQYILQRTSQGLTETSILATHIGNFLFRPQI